MGIRDWFKRKKEENNMEEHHEDKKQGYWDQTEKIKRNIRESEEDSARLNGAMNAYDHATGIQHLNRTLSAQANKTMEEIQARIRETEQSGVEACMQSSRVNVTRTNEATNIFARTKEVDDNLRKEAILQILEVAEIFQDTTLDEERLLSLCTNPAIKVMVAKALAEKIGRPNDLHKSDERWELAFEATVNQMVEVKRVKPRQQSEAKNAVSPKETTQTSTEEPEL